MRASFGLRTVRPMNDEPTILESQLHTLDYADITIAIIEIGILVFAYFWLPETALTWILAGMSIPILLRHVRDRFVLGRFTFRPK